MFFSICLFVTLSLVLIIIIRAPFCTSSSSSSFVIFHFLSPLPPASPPTFVLSLSPLQAAREKESSQAQLKVLSQQTEAARRELAEILGRLAQREEDLHHKEVELSKTRQRQLSLEQEIREVRDEDQKLNLSFNQGQRNNLFYFTYQTIDYRPSFH